jgi:hypothetical protein
MNRLTKPSAQMPPGNRASDDRGSEDAVPSLMRLTPYHAICPGNGLTVHVAIGPVTCAFAGPLMESKCEELNVSKSSPLCPRFCCKTPFEANRDP